MAQSDSNSESDVIRTVDHQIDTFRHYQESAQRFLRIEVSVLGLIITVGSALVSVQGFPQIASELDSQALRETALVFEQYPLLNPEQGFVVSVILLLVGVSLLSWSIAEMLVAAPTSQLRVISPDVFEPELQAGELSRAPTKESNFDNYTEVIENNMKILDKTKENLDNSFRNLRRGFYAGSMSVVMVLPLLQEDPLFIVLVTIVLGIFGSLYALYHLEQNNNLEKLKEYLIFVRVPDFGAFIVLAFPWTHIIFKPPTDTTISILLAIIFVIGLIIVPIGIIRIRDCNLPKYTIRNAIILLTGIIVFFVAMFFSLPDSDTQVVDLAAASVSVAGYLLIISIAVYLLSRIFEWLKSVTVKLTRRFGNLSDLMNGRKGG